MAACEGAAGSVQWTQQMGDKLQGAIDRIFEEEGGERIKTLKFSFTIADPRLEGCPLIGCSTGFGTLCGYTMPEIVGRNCRFLVDPVPEELQNANVRRWSREFCAAVAKDQAYEVPSEEKELYMPAPRPQGDGIFCVQNNARKDGTIFKNMFYLKEVKLGENPYIVGLQTELPEADSDVAEVQEDACRRLDENMAEVERVLASMFWFESAMRRQDDPDHDDGFQLADD